MSWVGFIQMERRQLRERLQGNLSRVLSEALSGESVEGLDRLGEQDQLRAERGPVAVMGKGGSISYEHIDALSTDDMTFRIAAERIEVGEFKERLARRKKDAATPIIPYHLG
jgi:hypothetical protein